MTSDFLDMLYSRMFFSSNKMSHYNYGEQSYRYFHELSTRPSMTATRTSKFAYLIMKNNNFARFVRAFFIFEISQTFSSFPRHEMSCFAVLWTTGKFDDKCSVLSSFLLSAGQFQFIAGQLEHIFSAYSIGFK